MHTPERRRPRRPDSASGGVLRGAAAVLLLAGGWTLAAGAAPEPLAAQEAQEARQAQEGDYEVERGDTLWDIARRLLNDPFRWQGIYQANRTLIEDPDLIFPGQRFAIPGRTAAAGAAGAGQQAAGQAAERAGEQAGQQAGEQAAQQARTGDERRARAAAAGDTAGQGVGEPRASLFDTGRRTGGISTGGELSAEERPALRPVSRSEVFSAPFLARRAELGVRGRVLGPATAGDRRVRAWQGSTGDEVRVALRGLNVSAGDTLFAVRTGRAVGQLGRVVQPTGVLRVATVRADTAVARVDQVYGLVSEGDAVVSTPVPPVPDATEFRPAQQEIRATFLEAADGGALLKEGGLVFLDSGSSDGVRPGDLFVAAPGEATAGRADRIGARVIVIRVRSESSTARVVFPGDGTVSQGATARLDQRLAASGR